MTELNRADYELILMSMTNDQRALRDTGEYLRRNGLGEGDQMVDIQKRMMRQQLAMEKIDLILLSM